MKTGGSIGRAPVPCPRQALPASLAQSYPAPGERFLGGPLGRRVGGAPFAGGRRRRRLAVVTAQSGAPGPLRRAERGAQLPHLLAPLVRFPADPLQQLGGRAAAHRPRGGRRRAPRRPGRRRRLVLRVAVLTVTGRRRLAGAARTRHLVDLDVPALGGRGQAGRHGRQQRRRHAGRRQRLGTGAGARQARLPAAHRVEHIVVPQRRGARHSRLGVTGPEEGRSEAGGGLAALGERTCRGGPAADLLRGSLGGRFGLGGLPETLLHHLRGRRGSAQTAPDIRHATQTQHTHMVRWSQHGTFKHGERSEGRERDHQSDHTVPLNKTSAAGTPLTTHRWNVEQ